MLLCSSYTPCRATLCSLLLQRQLITLNMHERYPLTSGLLSDMMTHSISRRVEYLAMYPARHSERPPPVFVLFYFCSCMSFVSCLFLQLLRGQKAGVDECYCRVSLLSRKTRWQQRNAMQRKGCDDNVRNVTIRFR